MKPYLFFVYWRHYVPKALRDQFTCVGFHMTDLPFGRGGSPLQNLILRGYTKTMISAFLVTEEWDAGPLLMKHSLSLTGSAQDIFDRASDIIYNTMIPHILLTHPTPTPQQGTPVFFHRINKTEYPEPTRMWDAWGYHT